MINWGDIAGYVAACAQVVRMMWRPTVWDAVVVSGTSLPSYFPYMSLDRVLASGAQVDVMGPFGITPFQLSIRDRNYAIARKLLAAGANVDGKDTDGVTALHQVLVEQPKDWSEQERQLERVSFLLEHGACAENAGVRLLHSGNPRLVKPLAGAGLDVSHFCVATALQSGDAPMLDAMLDVISDKEKIKSRLMQLSVTNGDAEAVKRLVACGADVNGRGTSAYTPLHIAVMIQKQEMVETLIILGADVNARVLDDRGQTSLHISAIMGNAAMAAMLMGHEADPKVKNNFGHSAEIYFAALNVDIQPHNLTRAKMDLARKRQEILRPVPPGNVK
ncbi:MAG TPA: hypothetical protein DCW68_01445 [Rhodospirillaceae bacterium]|nr:MAG: hypothetical protein A2018_04410 [Alphaproteobacteria bacterium GWF2_58_20]HAU28762.1 hypothetical protein [Rhodospirillaceae bacterium]